jgi:hypothetical protein
MKVRSVFVNVLLAVAAAGACSQSAASRNGAAAPETSAIVGVWRAQMDGLPAITLNVTDETGTLSGAVLFYLHRRDPGQPVTSSPGIPEPLMNPKFDGKTLTFQVSHRRAHPGSVNTPPVSFRLRIVGPNKGELVNENEPSLVVEAAKDKD